MSLVLSFAGWCVIRLATDPDPTDEPWGVSGYTFAFSGEPPLDRIVRFQPAPEFVRFPRHRDTGVTVRTALSTDSGQAIRDLLNAKVDLLGEPKLENRNHTLTAPGYEPIVPFHLQIAADGLVIDRYAPLDPDAPEQPVWEASADSLAAQGASGMAYEPDTVGEATGQWDLLALVRDRRRRLKERSAREHSAVKRTAFEARIRQLDYAIAHENDRRVLTRHYVERFVFAMEGAPGRVTGARASSLPQPLDLTAPWEVSFWIGAWDPDLLCAYVKGSLDIPFAPSSS